MISQCTAKEIPLRELYSRPVRSIKLPKVCSLFACTDVKNNAQCSPEVVQELHERLKHTVDTEFSVTNFFCLHFSEHAQWGLPVMSDILVKIFVDISCNICGLFLL